jgi:hypothetical protein
MLNWAKKEDIMVGPGRGSSAGSLLCYTLGITDIDPLKHGLLFFGFIMFVFSQFGGTKGLCLLVSITILVGMATNLIILPSLLLSLERRVITKSFKEPYFDIYDEEEDYDFDKLEIDTKGID